MKKLLVSTLILLPTLGWSMIHPLLIENLNTSYENSAGSVTIDTLNYFSTSRGGQMNETDVHIDVEKQGTELVIIKDGRETRFSDLPPFVSNMSNLRTTQGMLEIQPRELKVSARNIYVKSLTDEYTLNSLNGNCRSLNALPENRQMVQVLDLCTLNTTASAKELIIPATSVKKWFQIYENSRNGTPGFFQGGPEKLTNVSFKLVNHQFTLEGTGKRVISIKLRFTGRVEVLSAQNKLKIYLATATVGGISIKESILKDIAAQNDPRVVVDGSNITIDLVSSAPTYDDAESTITF